MDEYNTRCPYNGYHLARKGTGVLKHVAVGWALTTRSSVEGARHEGHIVYRAFMSSVQSRQIHKSEFVAWAWGEEVGGKWRVLPDGYRVSFGGWWKCPQTDGGDRLHNLVNIWKTLEFNILNGWILWHTNLNNAVIVKREKEKREWLWETHYSKVSPLVEACGKSSRSWFPLPLSPWKLTSLWKNENKVNQILHQSRHFITRHF